MAEIIPFPKDSLPHGGDDDDRPIDLACDRCGKNLALDPEMALFAWACDRDGPAIGGVVRHAELVCKGKCDRLFMATCKTREWFDYTHELSWHLGSGVVHLERPSLHAFEGALAQLCALLLRFKWEGKPLERLVTMSFAASQVPPLPPIEQRERG